MQPYNSQIKMDSSKKSRISADKSLLSFPKQAKYNVGVSAKKKVQVLDEKAIQEKIDNEQEESKKIQENEEIPSSGINKSVQNLQVPQIKSKAKSQVLKSSTPPQIMSGMQPRQTSQKTRTVHFNSNQESLEQLDETSEEDYHESQHSIPSVSDQEQEQEHDNKEFTADGHISKNDQNFNETQTSMQQETLQTLSQSGNFTQPKSTSIQKRRSMMNVNQTSLKHKKTSQIGSNLTPDQLKIKVLKLVKEMQDTLESLNDNQNSSTFGQSKKDMGAQSNLRMQAKAQANKLILLLLESHNFHSVLTASLQQNDKVCSFDGVVEKVEKLVEVCLEPSEVGNETRKIDPKGKIGPHTISKTRSQIEEQIKFFSTIDVEDKTVDPKADKDKSATQIQNIQKTPFAAKNPIHAGFEKELVKESLDDQLTKLVQSEALEDVIHRNFNQNNVSLAVQQRFLKILIEEILVQMKTTPTANSKQYGTLLHTLIMRQDQNQLSIDNQMLDVSIKSKNMLAQGIVNLQNRCVKAEKDAHVMTKACFMLKKALDTLQINFEEAKALIRDSREVSDHLWYEYGKMRQCMEVFMPNFFKYTSRLSQFKNKNRKIEEALTRNPPDLKKVVLGSSDGKRDWSRLWSFEMNQNVGADGSNGKDALEVSGQFFNGKPLSENYSKAELYLRHDLNRILNLFNVPIPARIDLEQHRKRLEELQFKHQGQGAEFDSVKQKNEANLAEIAQLHKVEASLRNQISSLRTEVSQVVNVPKMSKAVQVYILQDNDYMVGGATLQTSAANIQQNPGGLQPDGSPQIDQIKSSLTSQGLNAFCLALNYLKIGRVNPATQNLNWDTLEFVKPRSVKMTQDQAQITIKKILSVDFPHILDGFQPVPEVQTKQWGRKKFQSINKMHFQYAYVAFQKFVETAIDRQPLAEDEPWKIYEQVLLDNTADLMGGVQDLHLLGEEDWRFVLLQYLVGVTYHKQSGQEGSLVDSMLVDKHDPMGQNIVLKVLRDAKFDQDLLFSLDFHDDPEPVVEVDKLLSVFADALQDAFSQQRLFYEPVANPVLIQMYQKIQKQVKVFQICDSLAQNEEDKLLAMIDLREEDLEESQATIALLRELLFKIHNSQAEDQIFDTLRKQANDDGELEIDDFYNFIDKELQLVLPEVLMNKAAFKKFVSTILLSHKTKAANKENSESTVVSNHLDIGDIERLGQISIKDCVTYKDALTCVVQGAQQANCLKKALFSPVYNCFAEVETGAGLDTAGAFYQAILFVAKCTIFPSFQDNMVQQKLVAQVNGLAKDLIEILKKLKQVKEVSLTKFANACFDLNLTEYLPGAIKKLVESKGAEVKNMKGHASNNKGTGNGKVTIIDPFVPQSKHVQKVMSAIGNLDSENSVNLMATNLEIQRLLKHSDVETLLSLSHQLAQTVSGALKSEQKQLVVLRHSKFNQGGRAGGKGMQPRTTPQFNMFFVCEIIEAVQIASQATKQHKQDLNVSIGKGSNSASAASPNKKGLKKQDKSFVSSVGEFNEKGADVQHNGKDSLNSFRIIGNGSDCDDLHLHLDKITEQNSQGASPNRQQRRQSVGRGRHLVEQAVQATQFVARDSSEMIFYQINSCHAGIQCDMKSEEVLVEEKNEQPIPQNVATSSPEQQIADLDKLMMNILHGNKTIYHNFDEESDESDQQSELLRLPSHIKLSPRVTRNAQQAQKGPPVLSINKIQPKTKKINILSMYQKAIKAGKMGGTLQDLLENKKIEKPLKKQKTEGQSIKKTQISENVKAQILKRINFINTSLSRLSSTNVTRLNSQEPNFAEQVQEQNKQDETTIHNLVDISNRGGIQKDPFVTQHTNKHFKALEQLSQKQTFFGRSQSVASLKDNFNVTDAVNLNKGNTFQAFDPNLVKKKNKLLLPPKDKQSQQLNMAVQKLKMLDSFKKSKIGNNSKHAKQTLHDGGNSLNVRSQSQNNQPGKQDQTQNLNTLNSQGPILPKINKIGPIQRETNIESRSRQRSLTNSLNITNLSMTQLKNPLGSLKTTSYASLLQTQGDQIKTTDLILKDQSIKSQVLLSKIVKDRQPPKLIGEDQLRLPNQFFTVSSGSRPLTPNKNNQNNQSFIVQNSKLRSFKATGYELPAKQDV